MQLRMAAGQGAGGGGARAFSSNASSGITERVRGVAAGHRAGLVWDQEHAPALVDAASPVLAVKRRSPVLPAMDGSWKKQRQGLHRDDQGGRPLAAAEADGRGHLRPARRAQGQAVESLSHARASRESARAAAGDSQPPSLFGPRRKVGRRARRPQRSETGALQRKKLQGARIWRAQRRTLAERRVAARRLVKVAGLRLCGAAR